MDTLVGLILITLVSVVGYGLVDALKVIMRNIFVYKYRKVIYPIIATLLCVYIANLLHASIFSVLNAKFYGTPTEAYVITGILASLGAKEVNDRFGSFVGKTAKTINLTPSVEDLVDKVSKKLTEDTSKRVLGQ